MKVHTDSLIIGIDIDGVIFDIGSAMVPLLSELCSKPISSQDLKSWDLEEALGLPTGELRDFWDQLFIRDEFQSASPITHAIQSISSLTTHVIWLITSRPESIKQQTVRWLCDNGVHYDHIVFNKRGDKHVVGPVFDIFIEDFLEETISLTNAGIFTILKGSKARKEGMPSWTAYRELREQLVKDQKLINDVDPEPYQFNEDVAFNSPSAAAAVVLARNANGRTNWKIQKTGQTYHDWMDLKLQIDESLTD